MEETKNFIRTVIIGNDMIPRWVVLISECKTSLQMQQNTKKVEDKQSNKNSGMN